MAPSTTLICGHLRQIIWYHLDNDLFGNALFFAGRLHAIEPRNPDYVYILALCHLRSGHLKAAYDLCRLLALKREHLGCSYVFAQSCLGLEKYSDGISAIDRARTLWEGKMNTDKSGEWPRRCGPDASAFHCLLAKLCHACGDLKRAQDSYATALKLNPFMWDAFERLCDTGTTLRPSNVFRESSISPALLAILETSPAAAAVQSDPQTLAKPTQASSTTSQNADPFNAVKASSDAGLSLGEINVLGKSNAKYHQINQSHGDISLETPPRGEEGNTYLGKDIHAPSGTSSIEPPNAPLRKTRTQATALMSTQGGADVARLRPTATGSKPRLQEGVEVPESQDPLKAPMHTSHFNKRTVSGSNALAAPANGLDPSAAPQRRSVRLFKKTPTGVGIPGPKDSQDLKKAKATGTRGRAAVSSSTVGRVVSGNRKPLDGGGIGLMGKELRQPAIAKPETSRVTSKSVSDSASREHAESLAWILDLLSRLGSGYYALSRYDCKQALQSLQSVHAQQRETPWVLSQIGRAQFENNEHAAAQKTFARIRKLAPSRIKDMETYSTLLWHLKSELDLAFLAHELIEANRLSPQAWCTLGNSFSLQRDHEQALKCFKRTTQLDPTFAYGYTLQGHEHVSNEDYDKALQAYRKAIAANNRHYNGWFGIGRVYEKLGKFEQAQKHYQVASHINPGNAILVCHIGTVMDKQGFHKAALAEYDKACALAPKSVMGRFKRARTLLRLHKFVEALAEFLVLKDMAPDEANVHFMLGKTYKQLNDRANAIKHLTTALNLDPKAGPLIKEYMEALGEADTFMSDDEDDDEAMD